MSLLKQALESIELGVEDFENAEPRRVASAVRNLYAGVLLLLKEKLVRMSPPGSGDVLLYQKWRAAQTPGGVVLKGKGKNTVGTEEIIERFKDLGLSIDERRLRKLQEIRNDVEHHVSSHPEAVVRKAVAESFVIIVDALSNHLGIKPGDVLSQPIWNAMHTTADTYQQLRIRCKESRLSLGGIPDWGTEIIEEAAECPHCGSDLVEAAGRDYFESKFTCLVCTESFDMADFAERALASKKMVGDYIAMTDGADKVVDTCPSCTRDTFLVEEDVCAACGETRSYRRCRRCDAELGLDEQETGMCSYCDHVYEKMMRE